MSNLGEQIQDELDAIEALQTRSETPEGQPGDEWAGEYEAFAAGVQAALGSAAPDSIRNADGAIDASVDNGLTQTDELLVGNSQSVTSGPIGTTDEWVPLASYQYGGGTSFTTTSTSYVRVTSYQDYPIINMGKFSLTNIDQLGYSLVGGLLQNSTNDDVYIRVADSPTVEFSGTGRKASQIETINPQPFEFEHLEMKVDGGQGEAYGLSLNVWGQKA